VDTFAFIIHPIDPKRDVSRKFPLLGRLLNEPAIHFLSTYFPPVYISEIEGIVSQATGKEIKGWLIACPYTATRMLELPEKRVYRKIIQTGRLAEKLGAKILGLGAYTSVVGDGGLTIARQLDIPVTSGNAYTVSIGMQALRRAATQLGIPLRGACAAVVGATGAIGRICAEILSLEVDELYLIGRRREPLEKLKGTLMDGSPNARLQVSTQLADLRHAQLIVTVTSSVQAVLQPEYLRAGSVICDIARPRDTSARIAAVREDVLVIDGGVVDVPGHVDFHFDFGLPPGKAFACMAETMALALEGRFADYTLGRDISRVRVEEITAIAEKHGFALSDFRSFEHTIQPERIARVRELAGTQV
jgi:predicted amino acid dehydrogenase